MKNIVVCLSQTFFYSILLVVQFIIYVNIYNNEDNHNINSIDLR